MSLNENQSDQIMYTGNIAIQTIKTIYGTGLANSSSCQQCQGLQYELPG